MSVIINKRKLYWILSNAIDLVGVTDLYHGKRVAYIADRIASALKDKLWPRSDVIITGLLHDCGVSSTDVHEHLVMEMEWHQANIHCVRGEMLLMAQEDLKHLAPAVGMHHSRWELLGRGKDHLLGNLIFLADRVDVLAKTSHGDILASRKEVIRVVESHKGTLFAPELVEAFIEASSKDIFWLNWGVAHTDFIMGDWLNQGEEEEVEYGRLKHIFSLFSTCVDGKSPYTYNHSLGVASLAVYLATVLDLDETTRDKIELAGLLHDMGKLRVPDFILEKRGALELKEMQVMHHHSFDTYNILSRIKGLEDVSQWVFQHHEKLNGTGYPQGVSSPEISTEARILMVADIFQALAQDRPYRKGLDLNEILDVLEEKAEKGEIDSQLVACIREHGKQCLHVALNPGLNGLPSL